MKAGVMFFVMAAVILGVTGAPWWTLIVLIIVALLVLTKIDANRQARDTEYEMDDDDPRAEGDGG